MPRSSVWLTALGAGIAAQEILRMPAASCAPGLQAVHAQAFVRVGATAHYLTSGAGYDALMFGGMTETGKPSVRCGNGGISHNPGETVTVGGCDIAVRALLEAVLIWRKTVNNDWSGDERLALPAPGACDCHVHVFGPKSRFPLVRERTYTPKDTPTDELRAMLARPKLERVVLVQPSVYGTDNACMVDASAELGSGARGVAVLGADTPGSAVDDLHRQGVRGLRVNVTAGGPSSLDAVKDRLAAAAAALCARNGWHVQAFIPSTAIAPLAETFEQLPVPVVVDHFGLISPAAGRSAEEAALVRMLQSGRVWVKLSGAYRIAQDLADPAIAPLARRLAVANPERILSGSDWPHTPPHGGAHVGDDEEQPYRDLDTRGLLELVRTWFDDARLQNLLLAENPARLYGFGS